jgi:hypothetical protein
LNSLQHQCIKQHKPLFQSFEQCEDHQGVPDEPGFDVDSCKFELVYQQAIQPQRSFSASLQRQFNAKFAAPNSKSMAALQGDC